MKTAISIPDNVFQSAEQLAKRLGVSRSELYVKAVDEYIKTHKYQCVTESLNNVYSVEDSALDEDVYSLQSHSLEEGEW